MSDESFPKWFRTQLRRRDWTQADFARQSGFSTGTISHWSRGERTPDPPSVEKIADIFSVDPDLVLTLAGHRPATEPLKPDDPATEIVAKVKRIKWNPERVESIVDQLDIYLKFDRREREKGKGG